MSARKSNVRLMSIGSSRTGFYGTVPCAMRSCGNLLLQSVKEVTGAFNVPVEVKGTGFGQHYEIGPIDDKEIACKVIVDINNYYQHLVGNQRSGQETTYKTWKQKCEMKRLEKI